MTSKCVVPGCTSLSKDGQVTGISWHYLPKDEALLHLWLKSIPRADWIPSKWCQIGSVHFPEVCFTYESQDKSQSHLKTQVKKRRLKRGSVPTLFPSCPSYLSKDTLVQRSEASTSEGRRKSEEARQEEANETTMITTLQHLKLKIFCNANVIFYIAGYIAKSTREALSCTSCKEELIASEEAPKILVEEGGGDDASHAQFIESLNHGGLSTPSDLCFLACIYISNLFSALMESQKTRRQLLESQQVQKVFVEAIFHSMEAEPAAQIFLKSCKAGHAFKGTLRKIGMKMFNVLMKNKVKEVNEQLSEDRKRCSGTKESSLTRKALKLQSQSSK